MDEVDKVDHRQTDPSALFSVHKLRTGRPTSGGHDFEQFGIGGVFSQCGNQRTDRFGRVLIEQAFAEVGSTQCMSSANMRQKSLKIRESFKCIYYRLSICSLASFWSMTDLVSASHAFTSGDRGSP